MSNKSSRLHRLDQLLLSRGFFKDLKVAQGYILAAKVLVNDIVVPRVGEMLSEDVDIRLKGELRDYVSRAAYKLKGACEAFDMDLNGVVALDIGQSHGGFTDYLLQSGAAHVIGVDVAYGILDNRLRGDDRVTMIERMNARHLTRETVVKALKKQRHDSAHFDALSLVVMDVSFISVLKILPALIAMGLTGCTYLFLLKPQFESTKDEIGEGGIIADEALRKRIVDRVCEGITAMGATELQLSESVLSGTKGNLEYCLRFYL